MTALPTGQEESGPRWVVEVNEILLFTYGGTTSEAAEWWAVQSGRRGLAARIDYVGITPAGAVLYVACEDEEEARFMAGHMVAHGCHPRAVKAKQIGKPVKCEGCDERRPSWARHIKGAYCRPCHVVVSAWWKGGYELSDEEVPHA